MTGHTPPSPAVAFELSCRYIDTLLNIAMAECDRGEFARFLSDWQVDLEYLRNQANWVSQRFCEALTGWVVERVGLALVEERTTQAAVSEKALGFLVPLLRAFGSPRMTYAYTPRVAALLSKVSKIKVHEIKRGFGILEWRQPNHRVNEASPYLCHLRRAYLSAIPTLWRLPPAIINETVRLFWPTISTTRSFERRDLLFPARKCGDATLCLQRTISSAQTSIVMDYRTPLETMVMGDMGAFLGGWTFSCSI